MKKNRTRKPKKKSTRAISLAQKGTMSFENRQNVAGTTTGELVQPTRLHYTVADPDETERTLLKLDCMESDPTRKRWVWMYTKEASSLPLRKAPVNDSVVIGEFFWNGDTELVLNVRSIERALAAVEFFDRHLSRTLAKLTHVTVINRLFSVADINNNPSLQALFEQTPLIELDPDALAAKILTAKEQSQNVHQQRAAAAQIFEELIQRREPEMEKFPVHYYEDGIASLRLKLYTSQAVAVQHWKGNLKYTSYDAIQDMMNKANLANGGEDVVS